MLIMKGRPATTTGSDVRVVEFAVPWTLAIAKNFDDAIQKAGSAS